MEILNPHDRAVERLKTELDPEQLAATVRAMHPADIADALEYLHRDRRLLVFACLDANTAAEVLDEASTELRHRLIAALPLQRTSEIVEEMPADEAADLLNELPETHASAILGLMEHEDAEDVRPLLDYEGDTAGGQMTTEFIAVPENLTVEETISLLRELAPEAETIYYLYVVDAKDHLVGVVSLRTLIVSSPDIRVVDIMNRDVISVSVDTDQEDAAEIIARYNLVAVPVLDSEGRPIGIITVDDAVDVLDEEAEEDIYEAGGAAEENEDETGVLAHLKGRLPRLAAAFGQALAAMFALWVLLDWLPQGATTELIPGVFPRLYWTIAAFVPAMLALSWLVESQGRAALAVRLTGGRDRRESPWLRWTGDLSTTVFLILLCLLAVFGLLNLVVLPALQDWGRPLAAIAAGLCSGLAVAAAGAYLFPRLLLSWRQDREGASWPVAAAAHGVGVLVYLAVALRVGQP